MVLPVFAAPALPTGVVSVNTGALMPPAATPVPLPAAAPEHVTFKSVPAKMGTPAVKPAASCFAGRHSLSSDK
jgi:hypothetical protein